MRETTSALQSYTTISIKQQTSTSEVPFPNKFAHIMERIQNEHMITKDLVLELMQLFYKNNQLFLQMFEASFLIIFKTYGNEGVRFNKYESQLIIEKYSQLLKLLLTQMINLELQVQKSTEEQQYFENFVDFYLTFFAQGLVSSKSFIKECSFNILKVSFKIIDEVLDVELLPETEKQLVESAIYLLGSNFDDYKMMGVELYGILKRIKIASIEIQERLFEIIQNISNFTLRKTIIIQGISLSTSQNINRLLNRLKDKNPLIVSIVIQKLINEKIKFQELDYKQRMKILIDGVESCHLNARQKAIQFVGISLVRFLNFNNKANQFDQQEQLQISGVERFFRLFNSDHFIIRNEQVFDENQPISSIVLKSISQICLNIAPQLIKTEIETIIQKIQHLIITHSESAFIHSFLIQLSSTQTQSQETTDNSQKNKIELKKFITLANFLPSFSLTVSKIKKSLRQQESWGKIRKFAYILEILALLIQKFNVTDCAGKRQFYEQVRKFIMKFDYADKKMNDKKDDELFDENITFLGLQLKKLNGLLSSSKSQKRVDFCMLTHPLDLLSLGIEIFINLSQQNSQQCDSILQLKIHITQLLKSKQLVLQHEITTKMLVNTCMQISKAQNAESEPKVIQHRIGIKSELQKRLLENKRNINQNTIKAFTILARILSYQQNLHHYHVTIRASQYFDSIKNYLYHYEDESNNRHYYQSLSSTYLPYTLIYYYCRQNQQNYKSFKKLFLYYGMQQDKTVLGEHPKSLLTKLINLRLLVELQLVYECGFVKAQHLIEQNSEKGEVVVFAQQLISMIIFDRNEDEQTSWLQRTFYGELLLRIFNNSIDAVRNRSFFTILILISLQKLFQQKSQTRSFWIRQILITLQKLSTQTQTLIFQSLLISYEYILINFYQASQNSIVKLNINIFITQISRIFLNFFKITSNTSTQNCSQQVQKHKISFWRLAKIIKLLENLLEKSQSFEIISILRLKSIFHYLYEHFNNKQFGSEMIKIQLLVFIKNKLQRLLYSCKTKQQLQSFKKSKQYLLFISDIDQLNDKIEEEISKHINEKRNLFDQQQSTNHSPNRDNNYNQEPHQRIDFSLIETYEKTFNNQLKQQSLQIQTVINHIKKTQLFQKIFKILEQSYPQRQRIMDEVKTEIQQIDKVDQHLFQAIHQNPHSETHDITELFDRRGRRKDNTLSKKMNIQLFQAKASVKKNRYLIIPYEVVEKAESSSKKIKNYQNTIKRKKYTF